MSIRMATQQDLPQILAIYGPYILNTTASFEYTVPTPDDFNARFCAITAQFPWIVWEEAGEILGYAYASAPFHRAAYQWCAESSIYLHPKAQGQGIGKALCRVLEQILEKQGYRKVYAIITSANTDSIAFHQAIGYRFVMELPECGWKFGVLQGIVWLEKLLNQGALPGDPPCPIGQIGDIAEIFRKK